MPVHVGEMTSEVTTENAPGANAGAGAPTKWEELARVREMQAQVARDALRTSAEAYDD
jgi:hypothetical protein